MSSKSQSVVWLRCEYNKSRPELHEMFRFKEPTNSTKGLRDWYWDTRQMMNSSRLCLSCNRLRQEFPEDWLAAWECGKWIATKCMWRDSAAAPLATLETGQAAGSWNWKRTKESGLWQSLEGFVRSGHMVGSCSWGDQNRERESEMFIGEKVTLSPAPHSSSLSLLL